MFFFNSCYSECGNYLDYCSWLLFCLGRRVWNSEASQCCRNSTFKSRNHGNQEPQWRQFHVLPMFSRSLQLRLKAPLYSQPHTSVMSFLPFLYMTESIRFLVNMYSAERKNQLMQLYFAVIITWKTMIAPL